MTIDFVQRGLESGFHFENPNSQWKDPVAKAVQNVLDERSIGVITDAIAVPIAIVITAATVAAYHGSALWRDRGTLAALCWE